MENIAKALIIATQYIADRDLARDEDRDIEQLEYIASVLSGISASERRALEEASRKLGLTDWPEQIGLRSDVAGDA